MVTPDAPKGKGFCRGGVCYRPVRNAAGHYRVQVLRSRLSVNFGIRLKMSRRMARWSIEQSGDCATLKRLAGVIVWFAANHGLTSVVTGQDQSGAPQRASVS